MKYYFMLLTMSMALLKVNAQENYSVSKIPAELLSGASVVVRNESLYYDLKSPSSATMEYKTALTIINKSGEGASHMYEYYDKFSNVYNLKATLYDADGKKLKEYKSADFKDKSAVSEGTMYQDDRIKFAEFSHISYPYTIAYSYSVDYSGIRSYPGWLPASTWDYAVEKSSYVFRIPEKMTFKYLKSKGLKTDSVKIKDKIQYTWSCENLKPIEYEPMSSGLKNILPWVSPAPNEFEYDHSKATIDNWQHLGDWMYGLSKEMQVLPEPTKVKILELIKGCKNSGEKINVLYKYMQQNTRYVGVQLGIGGYQPIAASKVSAVSYGDCKGLSNYMKALLEVAGIKSHLVVIGHDMPSMNPNFASINQANHMILCVPLEKDTTWLECTNPYVPPGYIGEGNSDKTVMLVTENGGKLVQTPIYSALQNYQKRSAKVALNEEGNADISILATYGFAQYENKLSMLIIDPTTKRKRVINSLSLPNIQLEELNYSQPDKNVPLLEEKIRLKSPQLLSKGADKLFLTLNLLARQESAPSLTENRKTPFEVKYSYNDEDEIIYDIPKGYKVEFLPKDVILESEFGKYTAKAMLKGNTIVYTRTQTMTNKKYPPEKYNDYVAFSKKIFKADKQKSILAKAE